MNLVLFLTRVLGQDNASAANNVSKWTGTVYLCSLIGAFLSDSYWGRYLTCALFQVVFVLVTNLYLIMRSNYFVSEFNYICNIFEFTGPGAFILVFLAYVAQAIGMWRWRTDLRAGFFLRLSRVLLGHLLGGVWVRGPSAHHSHLRIRSV